MSGAWTSDLYPRERPNAPDRADALSIRRARWCGVGLGLIIALFILADLLRPSFVAVNISSEASSHPVPLIVTALHFLLNISIVLPSLILACFERLDFRRLGSFPLWAGGLVTLAVASILANIDIKSIAYCVILFLTFLSAGLFMASRYGRTEGAAAFMATVAIGCGLALLIAIGLGEYSWGRLASRAGPTYWGMVAIMAFSLSFAVRPLWLRGIVMALACAALVLSSARGGMLAIALSSIVATGLFIKRTPPARRGFVMAALIGVAIVSPVALAWIADHLLQLSDPSRGLASGATGRSFAWAQAWQLFVDHPLTGVGYRRHEQFITVATSSHEAYLAVMAELGAGGLVFYLILTVGAAIRLTARAVGERDALVPVTAAAFLWGYLMIGFTENLALGTGLAMPLAMIFVTAIGWSRSISQISARRRGTERWSGAKLYTYDPR